MNEQQASKHLGGHERHNLSWCEGAPLEVLRHQAFILSRSVSLNPGAPSSFHHTQFSNHISVYFSMDPLSVTASVIAVLQLTNGFIEYLNEVKGASDDQARCTTEAKNTYRLLVRLLSRLEEDPNDAWYEEVRALTATDGPLDQYRSAVEQFQSKLPTSPTGGAKKFRNALTWKFKKDKVEEILSRIERLKSLINIALEMDLLFVCTPDFEDYSADY